MPVCMFVSMDLCICVYPIHICINMHVSVNACMFLYAICMCEHACIICLGV